MSFFKIQGPRKIEGRLSLPGDKSIAHRFVILSCICDNSTVINNFPFNEDCLVTARALKSLGAKITFNSKAKRLKVLGGGLRGLKEPGKPVFVGESGTTLRLLLGVLSGQKFKSRLIGSRSLSLRPMLRVTAPLRQMGAKIIGRCAGKEEYLPIAVQGADLHAITYKMPVASAQVKSAILLAGLYARGVTRIIEPVKTRDHTERLLKAFRAQVKAGPEQVRIKGAKRLVSPGTVIVPGDVSSAAFFMVAAAITAGSRVLLKNVSLNPSRAGIIRILKRMGADVQVTRHLPVRQAGKSHVTKFEPMGDVEVKSSKLKGAVIKKSEIPSLIDELPVLMVAASCAGGKSRFEGVQELRVKETDRIKSMQENLRKMGVGVQVARHKSHGTSHRLQVTRHRSHVTNLESIVIDPPAVLKGAKLKSYGDHRTAMSMIVAGLAAQGVTTIDDTNCISKSFPDFLKVLRSVIR